MTSNGEQSLITGWMGGGSWNTTNNHDVEWFDGYNNGWLMMIGDVQGCLVMLVLRLESWLIWWCMIVSSGKPCLIVVYVMVNDDSLWLDCWLMIVDKLFMMVNSWFDNATDDVWWAVSQLLATGDSKQQQWPTYWRWTRMDGWFVHIFSHKTGCWWLINSKYIMVHTG